MLLTDALLCAIAIAKAKIDGDQCAAPNTMMTPNGVNIMINIAQVIAIVRNRRISVVLIRLS